MPRRLMTALLPVVLLTAGCAEARDAATTVSDCAGLAADVARVNLTGVPTQEEAEAAARRLADRVEELDSPTVREAAEDLQTRLRELQQAVAEADVAAARAAAEQARDAARRTAEACGLPADQFLSG